MGCDHRNRRRHRLARLAVAAVVPAGLLVSALAPAASGGTVSHKKTPLQQGQAYFHGKNITFVSPDGAGSNFDILARLIAPVLSRYLGANVVVEDLTAGNGVTAFNTIAHSNPDGLTIGWLNPSVALEDLLQGIPGVSFNPSHVSMLGATPGPDSFLCAAPSTGIKTFKQLQSNTGTSLKWLAPSSGSAFFSAKMLPLVFGLKTQTISAYSGSSAAQTGFLRGDGQVYYSSGASLGPVVTQGKCNLLAVTTPEPKDNANYSISTGAGVPDLLSLIKKFKPTNGLQKAAKTAMTLWIEGSVDDIYAAGKVPNDVYQALSWGLKKTLTDAGYEANERATGSAVGYVSGPVAKQIWVSSFSKLSTGLRIIGLCPQSGCPGAPKK